MTLDGTENAQDIETSEQTTGTSEIDPETLTEEERTQKAVSDALSAAGRTAKAMEAREKAINVVLSKAEKLQTDIKKAGDAKAERDYQADLSRAGDDPIAKSKVELDRSLKLAKAELADKEVELSKREEELTDARKVAAESTKERNAREIASKHIVDDPEARDNLAKSLLLTDGSVESMEALAKQISGREIPSLKVASSRTIGGRLVITSENIKDPIFYAKNREAIIKAMADGAIK